MPGERRATKGMENTERFLDANVKSMIEQAQKHYANLDAIATRALNDAVDLSTREKTNAATIDNLAHTSALRNSDLATDRQWNLDEQSLAVVNIQTLRALVEDAVASALANEGQ